jgi:aminoglycoside phosphotransferase (APT) family kinase protein
VGHPVGVTAEPTDAFEVALGAWLRDNIGVDGPVSNEIISGGASNLTIAVTVGDTELVVRRPPVGAFLPSANDVAREYTYLAALGDTDVPVPEVLGFCEDTNVIGAPFYVMRRLHGLVPHAPDVLAHLSTREARAGGEDFIRVLKAIHAVDIDAVGLGDAAKRSGYLERQVVRWTDQWHRAKDDDDPIIDALSDKLGAAVPASGPTTIVHGDYRLGNVMFDGTRVIGVLDWEMATLGDPLADLGYTLLWWGTPNRPPISPSQAVADLPGMPSADEVCTLYGAEPDAVRFYVVLAAFKLTIIGAGNRARAKRSGADVPDMDSPLAAWALDLLSDRVPL